MEPDHRLGTSYLSRTNIDSLTIRNNLFYANTVPSGAPNPYSVDWITAYADIFQLPLCDPPRFAIKEAVTELPTYAIELKRFYDTAITIENNTVHDAVLLESLAPTTIVRNNIFDNKYYSRAVNATSFGSGLLPAGTFNFVNLGAPREFIFGARFEFDQLTDLFGSSKN